MKACTQCGGLVNWVKIQGRWHCHNANGSDHWDTCSQRRWKQVVATGERFDKPLESGYRNSIHGTKLVRQTAGFHGRAPSGGCKGCVPPWQVCTTCPDARGVLL